MPLFQATVAAIMAIDAEALPRRHATPLRVMPLPCDWLLLLSRVCCQLCYDAATLFAATYADYAATTSCR